MKRISRLSELGQAVMLMATATSPAFADCSVGNRFKYNFAAAPAATLSYAGSSSYTAINDNGATQLMTVSFITDGTVSTAVNGIQLPAIATLINDGGTVNRNLVIGGTLAGRTADISANSRVFVTVFTFTNAIRDFTIQINDVDYTLNQFRDWVEIIGSNAGSSYPPALATPFGTNNSVPGPHISASSSMVVGAATTPVAVTLTQVTGTGASNNNSNTGTVTASFVQPVTRIEVRQGNYPLQTGETATGQQAIGIQAITFCPLPSVTLTKSATPLASAPGNFHTPGSDIIYALTLTNSNSSPVDIDRAIVTDPLPPQISFYNGDFNDAGPGTATVEFLPGTTGMTFSPSDISFSNNGGSSFGFVPASGYDPAVNAIRLNPKGVLGENSSVTFRFRARIK